MSLFHYSFGDADRRLHPIVLGGFDGFVNDEDMVLSIGDGFLIRRQALKSFNTL